MDTYRCLMYIPIFMVYTYIHTYIYCIYTYVLCLSLLFSISFTLNCQLPSYLQGIFSTPLCLSLLGKFEILLLACHPARVTDRVAGIASLVARHPLPPFD